MRAKNILLVEDNPNDEQLGMRALRRHNGADEIVVARDGQEALDYLLDENRPLPALVLLDLKLPKVSGLEVLQQLRANERAALLPVVVLSTSAEERDLLECYRAGCNGYVCKSLDFAQFVEVIRQIQGYWLVINEAPPDNRGRS